MTIEANLARIESELDAELTNSYREFMAQYPPQLLEPENNAANCELMDSADDVIEINQEVERYKLENWPDGYFAIGESGGGDCYAISRMNIRPSIFGITNWATSPIVSKSIRSAYSPAT